MTTAIATKNLIGTCAWAGHKFIAHNASEKVAVCPTCAPVDSEYAGGAWVQYSFIKWASVKARVTATKCSEACTSAKSDKCACACGGDHHGAALGLAW